MKCVWERQCVRVAPNETMKILAVDDDESILELITEFLTSFGYYDVVTASSGAEAIDNIAVEIEPFDCMLIDIQMPEMNGITLCKRIRMTPGYTQVPILMLTAMTQKKYIDEAFTAGATDYVTKPFDFVELQARLSDAQRIVSERKQMEQDIAAMQETKLNRAVEPTVRLNDPIFIEAAEGIIGYGEFENYVLQMSRARLFNSSVVAIKIKDIERIHASAPSSVFRSVIATAARAIAECNTESGNLVSYRGNGVFLLIIHGRSKSSEAALEVQYNDRVSLIQSIEPTDIHFSVLVGECVRLRSITKSGALFSLNSAVGSVEDRHATMKEVYVLPRKIFRANERTPEQNSLEKRAYQVLLQGMIMEERSLKRIANDNRPKSRESRDGLTVVDPDRPN